MLPFSISQSLVAESPSPPLYEDSETQAPQICESPRFYGDCHSQSPSPPFIYESECQSPAPAPFDESQCQSPSPSPALYRDSPPLRIHSPALIPESMVPETAFPPLDDDSQPLSAAIYDESSPISHATVPETQLEDIGEGYNFFSSRLRETEKWKRKNESMVAKNEYTWNKGVRTDPEAELAFEDDLDVSLSYVQWNNKYLAKGLLTEYKYWKN